MSEAMLIEERSESIREDRKQPQGESMKLLIRADKNETVASGHVQRCLSVADAFRDLGGDVTFVSSDHGAVSAVNGRGYD